MKTSIKKVASKIAAKKPKIQRRKCRMDPKDKVEGQEEIKAAPEEKKFWNEKTKGIAIGVTATVIVGAVAYGVYKYLDTDQAAEGSALDAQ